MYTDSARRSWAEPVIVTLAMVAPSIVPAAPTPSDAMLWLAAGTVQALSQFALLLVIIGVSGRLRDCGVDRPHARDIVQAALLLPFVIVAAKAVALLRLPGGGAGGASISFPPTLGAPRPILVTLSATFSLAIAYREELFYRIYLITSIRSRGAGSAAAAIVSTALFAAGHAYQGASGLLSSALVGSIMAVAAIRGLRLHALALAHAAYDFVVLAAAFGLLS